MNIYLWQFISLVKYWSLMKVYGLQLIVIGLSVHFHSFIIVILNFHSCTFRTVNLTCHSHAFRIIVSVVNYFPFIFMTLEACHNMIHKLIISLIITRLFQNTKLLVKFDSHSGSTVHQIPFYMITPVYNNLLTTKVPQTSRALATISTHEYM